MFLCHKKSYLTVGAIAIILLAGVLFDIKAAPGDRPLAGFAWSSNIGWISFNSSNCDTDGDGTFEGLNEGGGVTPAPAGCPIAGAVFSYSVVMDNNDKLSGYAWSENIGWITFNKAVAGVPPGAPYNGGQPFMAKKNGSDEFEGWARALSYGGGWDGWINLRNNAIPYGVSLNGNDFEGFAWSDMVVGWISFNSTNTGAAVSYKVYLSAPLNNRPVVSKLTEIPASWCTEGPGQIKLMWTILDDIDINTQTGYQMTLTRDGDSVCSTGYVPDLTSAPFVYASVINSIPTCPFFPNFIDYGHNYAWTVITRDSGGLDSLPVSSAFSPPPHQYPTANFSVTPNPPLQFQTVTFDASSLSACYDVLCSFEWNFGDGFSATGLTASHIYSETGPFISTLKVTDFDDINHNCTASQNININSSKPTWNEVVPKTND